LPSDAIEHDDCSRIRNVDEYLIGLAIELKALGMGRQWKNGRLPWAGAIDYRNGTAAISNQDMVAGRIDAYVVRIAAEIDSPGLHIVWPSVQTNRSIAAICHIDDVA
jgi:hypothetical protein